MDEAQKPVSPEHFVNSVIARCEKDKGLAARLRRADNPATEYQSWEVLADYNINLEWENQRLPFATIAANIAKSKARQNGGLNLGQAIAAAYPEGNQSDQAKARLRRLLACEELDELCRILRPLLTLVDSRVAPPIDYIRLLRQLLYFYHDKQNIKAQWAQEFYRHKKQVEAPQ
ncbi:type I-E CRISPR-associated protein Cse2/CasB [Sinimarinibacterium sp. NLF-5-8]|uniref:type I-E CRISPR-associated protein Cse2/CasB n=1 Tax=Sinimarinibacterium sp. NLF-5-8 TaxID=2698684 RepID=UPI00137BE35A|nr:type I-E CRISPR-associated protein Cse2/CasB [Sinimarinibacterium sp. NLF-5-8]QHS10718.1 type I-E CRISPR-associated protein Cse2/CasB [Sinimarinibacterium sp. NLF-5-8]